MMMIYVIDEDYATRYLSMPLAHATPLFRRAAAIAAPLSRRLRCRARGMPRCFEMLICQRRATPCAAITLIDCLRRFRCSIYAAAAAMPCHYLAPHAITDALYIADAVMPLFITLFYY